MFFHILLMSLPLRFILQPGGDVSGPWCVKTGETGSGSHCACRMCLFELGYNHTGCIL